MDIWVRRFWLHGSCCCYRLNLFGTTHVSLDKLMGWVLLLAQCQVPGVPGMAIWACKLWYQFPFSLNSMEKLITLSFWMVLKLHGMQSSVVVCLALKEGGRLSCFWVIGTFSSSVAWRAIKPGAWWSWWYGISFSSSSQRRCRVWWYEGGQSCFWFLSRWTSFVSFSFQNHSRL